MVLAMLVAGASGVSGQATGTLAPGSLPAPDLRAVTSTVQEALGTDPLSLEAGNVLEDLVRIVRAAVVDATEGYRSQAAQAVVDETLDSIAEVLGDPSAAMESLTAAPEDFVIAEAMRVVTAAYEREVVARTQLAILLADPALDRTGRSSNWSLAVTANRGKEEAKIQFNLCDAKALCPGRTAMSVVVVSPVGENDQSTALLDFDGLVGKSRVEVDVSSGIGEGEGRTGRELLLSLKGRVAQPTFTFADAATLEATEVEETVGSFGAALVGRLGTHVLAQVSLERQWAVKSQPTQELCVPLPAPSLGAVFCRDTPIGEPADADQNVLSILVATRIGQLAAVRAEARQNRTSGNWLLDVPIYLIPNADGQLAGGVRLAHAFDTGDTSVSLFVSLFKL